MIDSPYNDEMDEARKRAKMDSDFKIKMARESIRNAYKIALQKIGPDRLKKEMADMSIAIASHNGITGANVRPTIQHIDAMILCLSAIPGKCGWDIFNRPGYNDFTEVLYAIRQHLADERDKVIAKSLPDISTGGDGGKPMI